MSGQVGALDLDGLRDLFADDAAWELAYGLDGVSGDQQTVRGRDTISTFHQMLLSGIAEVGFFDIEVHPVHDGLAFVQFRSQATTTKGQPYGNRYVARCDARDGRITHWLEFFDPRPAEMVRADMAETLAQRNRR